MPLKFRCRCGSSMTVPTARAGTQVRCPACEQVVDVPKLPAHIAAEREQRKAEKAAKKKSNRPAEPPKAKPKPKQEPPDKQPAAKATQPPPLPKKGDAATRPKAVPTSKPTPPAEPPAKANDAPPSEPAKQPTAPQPAVPPPPPGPDSTESTLAEPPVESGQPFDGDVETPAEGIEHEPGKVWAACQLALMVAGLAAIGVYPAIAEVVRHVRDFDSTGVGNWIYLVFFICGLQMVYAVYLFQVPDWGTVWVTMIANAAFATLYAIGTSMALMATESHGLIQALELGDLLRTRSLALWCFLMMLITATATYLLIRFSVRWKKAYDLVSDGL